MLLYVLCPCFSKNDTHEISDMFYAFLTYYYALWEVVNGSMQLVIIY